MRDDCAQRIVRYSEASRWSFEEPTNQVKALSVLNIRHPFFNPLWRRVAMTASCVLWAGVEAYNGSWAWAALMMGIAAMAVYQFFLAWEDQPVPGAPASASTSASDGDDPA